jgi:hypothetical protein
MLARLTCVWTIAGLAFVYFSKGGAHAPKDAATSKAAASLLNDKGIRPARLVWCQKYNWIIFVNIRTLSQFKKIRLCHRKVGDFELRPTAEV